MRVAIYVRVSTDEQAREGFSIEAQKRKLLAYCESQDWTIVHIFIDDGYSAKDLKRPEMQRMINLAKENEFDVLLVYKLDRLTRSVADCDSLFRMFDQLDIKFQSATESFETRTATGRLFIRLVADLAQWERENIAERVRMGMEQKVLQGQSLGGVIPYGYMKNGELIQEEADLIREVRDLFLSNLGYKTIAMKMNKAGKLRRGNHWSDATVQYTIENPFYAGIIRMSSKTKEGRYVNTRRDERAQCVYGKGSHDAIFSEEEYTEIKKKLKLRSKGTGFSRHFTYWFSGVLRCGRCGSSMFGRLSSNSASKNERVKTPYYICSARHHKKTCNFPIFRQVHVEKMLLDYLGNIILDQEKLKNPNKNAIDPTEKKIKQLESSMIQIKERRKKFQYMFVNDLITAEELKSRLDEELEEELQLAKDLERAISSVNQTSSLHLEQIQSLIDLWTNFDDQDKKDFTLGLFSSIVINTDQVNPRVKGKFFDAWLDSVSYN